MVYKASSLMHWKSQNNDHGKAACTPFLIIIIWAKLFTCLSVSKASQSRFSIPYFEPTSGPLLKLAPTSLTDSLTPSGRLLWIISKKISANVALKPLICKRKEDALREALKPRLLGRHGKGSNVSSSRARGPLGEGLTPRASFGAQNLQDFSCWYAKLSGY